jgi:RIO-like serine/threonine protein kinase
MEFYGFMGIEKVSIKEYVEKLRKELKKQGIKNDFIYSKLDSFSKKKIKLLVTTLHGDFAKENTLVKDDGEIIFIDWHPYEGLITNGIINYFRSTLDIQSSFYFKKIIKAFPKEVQKNIRTYLVLSEIDLIVKKNRKPSMVIKRIKNIQKPIKKNPTE